MWRPLDGGSRYGSSAVMTSRAAGYLHYRVRRTASRCDTPIMVITIHPIGSPERRTSGATAGGRVTGLPCAS
jgi:hypothetical protein